MKPLRIDLGIDGAVAFDEEGSSGILSMEICGAVSLKVEGDITPEAAVALSRRLAQFAMRNLPEAMRAEISDGIPTMSPEFETTGVGSPPGIEAPHRTSG